MKREDLREGKCVVEKSLRRYHTFFSFLQYKGSCLAVIFSALLTKRGKKSLVQAHKMLHDVYCEDVLKPSQGQS